MSDAQRAKDWIIGFAPKAQYPGAPLKRWFISDVRGSKIDWAWQAHGFHYKKEALEAAKSYPGATVERRGKRESLFNPWDKV